MKEDKSIMSALLLLLGFEINLSIDSKTPSGNKYIGKNVCICVKKAVHALYKTK